MSKTKQEGTPFQLRDKAYAVVTKKGGELKHNKWKEGDSINAHPNLINYFIDKGWAQADKKKSKAE